MDQRRGGAVKTMMNGLELHHGALKRRWDEQASLYNHGAAAAHFYRRCEPCGGPGALDEPTAELPNAGMRTSAKLLSLSGEDGVAAAVVPPVTVVLEGRSICHRVYLDRHTSYESLAKALRRMFVDVDEGGHGDEEEPVELSNAVPGYVVAYEDMEDDLLLVGDLNWKDFVRVVKRIRVIPAKASRRKHCGGEKMV